MSFKQTWCLKVFGLPVISLVRTERDLSPIEPPEKECRTPLGLRIFKGEPKTTEGSPPPSPLTVED